MNDELDLALQQAGYNAPAQTVPAAPTGDTTPAAETPPTAETPVGGQPEFDGEDVSAYFQEAPEQPAAAEPTSTSAAQPTISPDVASLLQQNQQMLQQQFAMQSSQSQQRVQELEARLAAYEQAAAPAEQAKPWYEDVDVPALTDEQLEPYKASLPIIEAVARRQALEIAKRMQQQYVDPMHQHIQQTLQPLQETANTAAQQAQAFQEQSMRSTIAAKLPWLAEARNTPEYNEYYNAVIPGTGGLTRKVLLEQAYQVGNTDAMIDLLAGFKPPQPQNPAQYVAPGRGNTTTTSAAATPQRKKGMKLSTYNKALSDFSNGSISPAKFAEYETAWYNALAAGTAVVDE